MADEQQQKAIKATPHWKAYLKQNRKKIEKQDQEIHTFHHQAMKRIDCLSCANCCRTLGPRITDRDVEKMAKALRIKPADFTTSYLKIDEDHDFVFKSMPCPFLMSDNYCSMYENRPKACREYPHTDRKKFFQLFSLSIKNAETCPVVYDVLEAICKK